MDITTILKGYYCAISGAQSVRITGITYDSRAVKKGFLFVAIRGEKSDGHDFIEKAIAKGAGAVVYETMHAKVPAVIGTHHLISWIGVNDCRDALAALSNNFYGERKNHYIISDKVSPQKMVERCGDYRDHKLYDKG